MLTLAPEDTWEFWGPQQDLNSVRVIETVLDAEPHTDLVVLNGDLITGENTFLENSTHYVDQMVRPMVRRGLTWASAYGNHDNDYNISTPDILVRERLWPNARTMQMVMEPNTGVSNYYLPVYASDCQPEFGDCSPELLLWFFDSRGGFHFQQKDPATGERIGQPNWVDVRVADWFQRTNAQLVRAAGGRVIPSLGFVHIPTNASLAVQEAGVDPHRHPGINDDQPVSQQGQGWCADGTATNDSNCEYGEQDVPFMRAITSTPGFMALFSAHDHGDTWCYRWYGINLCFGQHSGYGGYGSWIRGARQVVVSREGLADLAVDTYIRLESGAKVGAVTLNSTYGEDEYPATSNDRTKCPTCGGV